MLYSFRPRTPTSSPGKQNYPLDTSPFRISWPVQAFLHISPHLILIVLHVTLYGEFWSAPSLYMLQKNSGPLLQLKTINKASHRNKNKPLLCLPLHTGYAKALLIFFYQKSRRNRVNLTVSSNRALLWFPWLLPSLFRELPRPSANRLKFTSGYQVVSVS